jgi:hypothetical protein
MSLEYSSDVVIELPDIGRKQAGGRYPVVIAVCGKPVVNNKNDVVCRQKYSTNIMHRNSRIETNQVKFLVGIVHTYSGDYQHQKK